jgi:hypothetical protein
MGVALLTLRNHKVSDGDSDSDSNGDSDSDSDSDFPCCSIE